MHCKQCDTGGMHACTSSLSCQQLLRCRSEQSGSQCDEVLVAVQTWLASTHAACPWAMLVLVHGPCSKLVNQSIQSINQSSFCHLELHTCPNSRLRSTVPPRYFPQIALRFCKHNQRITADMPTYALIHGCVSESLLLPAQRRLHPAL